MSEIKEIPPTEAKADLDSGSATFFDIRDPGAYAAGHLPGAVAVSDANVQELAASTDKAARLVIYCYHGNSSLGAVGFFQERGFTNVVSMSGGFEGWKVQFPQDIAR